MNLKTITSNIRAHMEWWGEQPTSHEISLCLISLRRGIPHKPGSLYLFTKLFEQTGEIHERVNTSCSAPAAPSLFFFISCQKSVPCLRARRQNNGRHATPVRPSQLHEIPTQMVRIMRTCGIKQTEKPELIANHHFYRSFTRKEK